MQRSRASLYLKRVGIDAESLKGPRRCFRGTCVMTQRGRFLFGSAALRWATAAAEDATIRVYVVWHCKNSVWSRGEKQTKIALFL